MTFDFKQSINISGLENFLQKDNEELKNVVKMTAFEVQAHAAAKAPVDTGALKNSLEAQEKDAYHWIVTDGVHYGVYQELGTSRGVSAKHFLGNACEKLANKFFDKVKKALWDMRNERTGT